MDGDPGQPRSGNGIAPVRNEHSGAFVRLSRLWNQHEHFSLVFATVEDPAYRDALISRLDAVAPAARADLQADETAAAWLAAAERAVGNGARRLHLCLPLDRPRTADWWKQANLLRERIADALPGFQVLWMTDADVDLAAHQAPDLWNWRDSVLPFASTVGVQLPALPGERFDVVSGVDEARTRERLSAIQRYLAGTQEDLAAAHLRFEAALMHRRLGQWEEGLEEARRAAAAFTSHGDDSDAALAKTLLADLLWGRGEVDLALNTLREEVLPVFRRLGDLRHTASTLGQVAHILQAQGRHDEALRIRREDELPVYERLGADYEKAITIGAIADILKARGQLDEALRMRREQQLPTLERLGAAREIAVVMGSIADILAARGDLDEALRIWREGSLPIFERLGAASEKAVTMGRIAEVLRQRGQLDEALRVLRADVLPVFVQLGDPRNRAATMGKIADILVASGEPLEALRIRREEQMPVFERLGHDRDAAAALYGIAANLIDLGRWADADAALSRARAACERVGETDWVEACDGLRRRLEESRAAAQVASSGASPGPAPPASAPGSP